MRSNKAILVTFSFLITLWAVCPLAWGAGGGPVAPCEKDPAERTNWPGITLRGVASVLVTNVRDRLGDMDVIVRLRRGDKEEFFRIHLFDVDLLSPAHVACAILDAKPKSQGDPGQTIEQVFSISPTMVPRLDSTWLQRDDYQPIRDVAGNLTGRLSALANVVLHYVEIKD
jgi:hypothetical protein